MMFWLSAQKLKKLHSFKKYFKKYNLKFIQLVIKDHKFLLTKQFSIKLKLTLKLQNILYFETKQTF